ncbi:sensor histidine kinase [Mitsuaria sp. WAJ17]|uniref:sensor histidine kinase n=1 Tax=Mitsuaria sp. WAJ17 TaxID=2761452 RepID=UPI0016036C41|nr:ATP-binding protein [Mitsuaria sp. WAJ17]MBB2484810.1 sensor histidine kinase [Mitsuaria sp. WAJ17]
MAEMQRGLRILLGSLAAALLVGGAGWLAYAASLRQGTEVLRRESNHQLELFAAAAEGVIKRQESIPATLQLSPEVLALLREPQSAARAEAASLYLRRLNAHLGSLELFVQNQRGQVLASSEPGLLGEDLSFRPYFLEALAGRVGRHFAIGTRDGRPGYYVSHPIHDGARVVGVAAIKIKLDPINEAWATLGSPALLADSNQVVILSSEPAWRYTSLAELSVDQRVDLQLSRLYAAQPLPRFPLQVDLRVDEDSQVVEGVLPNGLGAAASTPRLASRAMLVMGRTLNGMDWRLMMFSDLRPVRQQASTHGLLASLGLGVVLLSALILLQRRRILRQKLEAHAELEDQVGRRTQALSEANARLAQEVTERQQAEATLRRAQDELVHAGKMAALGQLATGITHELAQPLGAIRTLAGNALEFMRREDLRSVQGNLEILTRLADQMGQIIQPLKGFARKSQARPQRCDVGQALGNALFLHDQRIRQQQVSLERELQPGQVFAFFDPNRLEQVLLNLIGNALDAVQGQEERVIRVQAMQARGQVLLLVHDSGPGLGKEALQRLFEPFFTTKEQGTGLGLGLAISRDIAREGGGELEARNHPQGGAEFILHLPAADAPEAPDGPAQA